MPLSIVANTVVSVAEFGNWQYPMLKHADDLARYERIIAETRPQVIIETGTCTGDSAIWLADRPGVELVISIDVDHRHLDREAFSEKPARVQFLKGSSGDREMVARARAAAGERRCMVSLDSDHSRDHVIREIALYAPLVSVGCYLVVEDGILAWLDSRTLREHVPGQEGNPLQAIASMQIDTLGFEQDTSIEALSPVSMHPAGWWRRIEEAD